MKQNRRFKVRQNCRFIIIQIASFSIFAKIKGVHDESILAYLSELAIKLPIYQRNGGTESTQAPKNKPKYPNTKGNRPKFEVLNFCKKRS